MTKINSHARLIFSLLTLLTTSVIFPTYANGQSKVEAYLRNADLDSDGRIEPHEMTGPIKRYLNGRGYDINERHKIREIVKASERTTQSAAAATASTLKVPKFGVEPKEVAGVGNFAGNVSTVKYSEAVTKKTQKLFEDHDRNGNGILDEGEIQRMNWGSPRPSTNDTNGDGRLSFNEILGRYHDREVAEKRSDQSSNDRSRGGRGDRERGGDDRRGRYGRYGRGESSSPENRSSSDSTSSRSSSTSEKSTASSPQASSGSSSSSDSSDAQSSRLARSKSYVDKYFADRDKDNNGVLEGEELKRVRSKSKYDTNRDGKITSDEMLAVIAPSSSKSNSNESSSSDKGSSKTSSRKSKASGSFTEVDTNADRLVQMHEFSETWTKKQLDEFLAKDKNGDGVISPEEW